MFSRANFKNIERTSLPKFSMLKKDDYFVVGQFGDFTVRGYLSDKNKLERFVMKKKNDPNALA